jgi:outer membrane translocation and assembly module TamA
MLQRVEMEEPRAGQSRYIEEYAETLSTDLFSSYKSFGGIAWEFQAGHREGELFNHRGSLFRISGRHLTGLGRAEDNFSSMDGSLSFYHSFRERSRLVFAGRVGGGINRGKYPFYQAQVLDGKAALRGFRETRFYGDSKMFANFEVRVRLLSFKSYLFPASLGILGFHDVGRIWYKNENGDDPSVPDGKSGVWHKGWGGGIWFTPFNLTVLSMEMGHSPEGTLGYVRLGFLF